MRLLVHFDGACSANGTPRARASFGWLVERLTKDGVKRIASGRGRCRGEIQSNNVAEYDALIDALLWLSCLDPAPTEMDIRGDSMNVIFAVNAKKKTKGGVNSPLPYIRERCIRARELLAGFACPWTVTWVPREENTKADELSTSV